LEKFNRVEFVEELMEFEPDETDGGHFLYLVGVFL